MGNTYRSHVKPAASCVAEPKQGRLDNIRCRYGRKLVCGSAYGLCPRLTRSLYRDEAAGGSQEHCSVCVLRRGGTRLIFTLVGDLCSNTRWDRKALGAQLLSVPSHP